MKSLVVVDDLNELFDVGEGIRDCVARAMVDPQEPDSSHEQTHL